MRELAQFAVEKIKSLNVSADCSLNQTRGFSVTARMGDVETLQHHDEKNFGVTIYHDHRTGSASSSDFSKESIIATIDKAFTIASFSHPDPYSGLPDPKKLAQVQLDCDLYHPWDISPQQAIQMAIDCEKKACAFDSRIKNSDGASVSSITSHVLYANTLGFIGEVTSTEHGMSCGVIAGENDHMQREDEYTVARNPRDLWLTDVVAKRAAEKTIKRLGAKQIHTQTCPVIFEAPIAKTLLRAFIAAISGGNLYRQSSFLLNSLGEKIFPDFVNIEQHPFLLSAMGSTPFDGEGVTVSNQHYIRNGELVSYVLSSYSARKLGLETTGNAGGVFNLSLSHSDLSFEQLIKKMNRGLLVTELMGQGINITTGDYSRGASGFWVDNGEIQFPVEGITIANNLKSMFANLVAVSNDIDTRGTIRTGSILLDHMTIAGS